jgi:two-component sensor histidine kinase
LTIERRAPARALMKREALTPGMLKQQGNLRGPLGYVLGVAAFLLAFALTSTLPWFHHHYPYLAYFLAALAVCFLIGPGPANLIAVLSAATVYFTYSPGGFLVTATQTPASAAIALILLILVCNGMFGALKASRDRLIEERERYARLAESRDLLYRELQHRVSNNIQIISGLLMLQGQALGDRGAKRALTEASSRVGLIARIQRRLHAEGGERAPFHVFARDLVADAIAASGAPGVGLEVEGGEAPLHDDQATAVSLVLLECVNNALEHGFAGRDGVLKVSLVSEGARHVLTVTDDGQGLPEGFEAEGGKSLGLRIVRAMATQLGGVFSITRHGDGVACRLRFPAKEIQAP